MLNVDSPGCNPEKPNNISDKFVEKKHMINNL